MDILTQQNAWIAAMISATVGSLSMLIAFISNREKLAEFFRKYWILLVLVFGAAVFGTFYYFGGVRWTTERGMDFIHWLLSRVPIPIWALFLIPTAAFFIPIVFAALVRFSKQISDVTEIDRLELNPDLYTEDEIMGVYWKWTYRGNIIGHPEGFCPQVDCRRRLDFRDDWNRARGGGYAPVSAHCPRCGFSHPFQQSENEVRRLVAIEIEGLLSTGQYKERLAIRIAAKKSPHNR